MTAKEELKSLIYEKIQLLFEHWEIHGNEVDMPYELCDPFADDVIAEIIDIVNGDITDSIEDF